MPGLPIDAPSRARILELSRGGSGVRAIARILATEAAARPGSVQAVSVASVGRLIQEHRAEVNAGASPAKPSATRRAPSAPRPPSQPQGSAARPAPPADASEASAGPWAALRRILDARAPDVVADVQAGLEAYAGGGRAGLEAWLSSRPAPAPLAAADPEKVAALRKMVASGTFDASAIPRLAAGMGVSEADVRALVASAAGAAGRDAMPPELAAEESIGVMLEVRKKALEANDWKSAQAAQVHIDKVRLFARKLPARAGARAT